MGFEDNNQRIGEQLGKETQQKPEGPSAWHDELLAYAQLPKDDPKVKTPAKPADGWGTVHLGLFPNTEVNKLPDPSKRVKYSEMVDGKEVEGYKFIDSGKIPGQEIDYTTTWYWSLDEKLAKIETHYRQPGDPHSTTGFKPTDDKFFPTYANQNISTVSIEPTVNEGQQGYYRNVFTFPVKDPKSNHYLAIESRCFVRADGKTVSSEEILDEGDPSIREDDIKYRAFHHKTVLRYKNIQLDETFKQMSGTELKGYAQYDGETGDILRDCEITNDGKFISQTIYDRGSTEPKKIECSYDAEGNPSIRTEYDLDSNKIRRLVEYGQDDNKLVINKETKYGYLGDDRNLVTQYDRTGQIGLSRAVVIPENNGEPDKIETLLTFLPDTKQITIETFNVADRKLSAIVTLGPDTNGAYRTESVKIPVEGALIGQFHEITYKDGKLPFITAADSSGKQAIIGLQGMFKTKNGKTVSSSAVQKIFGDNRTRAQLQQTLSELQKLQK